ncbi:protein-domain-containing protein [Phlyctochytrium arcticum]|nr:protein-domain-containing protein [Phlyctochytrium arcticum]
MANTAGPHVLFALDGTADRQDPREKDLRAGFEYIQETQNGRTEGDLLRILHEQVDSQHNKISGGLLYAILADQNAAKSFSLLQLVATDNFNHVLGVLMSLAGDTDLINNRPFRYLRPTCRSKIIWLMDKLAATHLQRLEPLIILMLRQIKSGSTTIENLALERGMINILNKHWERLNVKSDIIPVSVYTYARLVADHSSEVSLQQAEVEFVCTMLRKRFHSCLRIGRDLLRVLLAVHHIPAISDIISDMINRPASLDPSFQDFKQLLATPTSPFIIAQRVTKEVDVKIRFILDQVKTNLKGALIRSFRNTLLTNANDSIYADLIRFICTAIHPPNNILGSNIVQRWELILRLLPMIKNSAAVHSANLAIFFDWLCWNPGVDNIMCIEPAILLMDRASHPPVDQPAVAAALIDFLYKTTQKFLPAMEADLRRNVGLAMRSILKMGVVSSLQGLLKAPGLANNTLHQLESLFPQVKEPLPVRVPSTKTADENPVISRPASSQPNSASNIQGGGADNQQSLADQSQESAFVALTTQIQQLSAEQVVPAIYGQLFEIYIKDDIQSKLCQDAMYNLLSKVRSDAFMDQLVATYNRNPLEQTKLLDLLARGYERSSKFGGFICTYVLQLSSNSDEEEIMDPRSMYRRGLTHRLSLPHPQLLLQDLRVIHEQQEAAFYNEYVPLVFRAFPEDSESNVKLIEMIISLLDYGRCSVLCNSLRKGQYRMFGTSKMLQIFTHALEKWDDISIMFFWRLVVAEKGNRVDDIENLLEALMLVPDLSTSPPTTDALLMLCRCPHPSPRLLWSCLSRIDIDGADLLQFWWSCATDGGTQLASALAQAMHRGLTGSLDINAAPVSGPNEEDLSRLQTLFNHLANLKLSSACNSNTGSLGSDLFKNPLLQHALMACLQSVPFGANYAMLLQ